LLTGIIAITGILFSWDIVERTKEFFAFLSTAHRAVYGVFLSCDLFYFLFSTNSSLFRVFSDRHLGLDEARNMER